MPPIRRQKTRCEPRSQIIVSELPMRKASNSRLLTALHLTTMMLTNNQEIKKCSKFFNFHPNLI